MADSNGTAFRSRVQSRCGKRSHLYLVVLFFASAVYLGCIVSPPSLMDDVDAVQAQIARNMLRIRRLGHGAYRRIAYLEKPPLVYWIMAVSYKVFGVHDWAARIPIALVGDCAVPC